MRLAGVLFAVCTLVSNCLALQARDAHLAFPNSGKRGIMIGKIDSNTQEMQKPLVIDNSTGEIDFSFAIEARDRPSQVALLLGLPERDLEVVMEPKVTEHGELIMYKFKIDQSTVPKALLYFAQAEEQPLTASVILAKPENHKNNVLASPFKIRVDLDEAVEYRRPARYGAKPEIIHEFNPEPKTAPWKLVQFFIILIALATFGLVIAWMSSGALNFNSVPTNFNVVYLLFFILSIIGFEYIFVRYYAGTSIFDTLFAVLYLAIPSLWLGTKFLRNFGETI
ncbi:hypothetical protein HG536_0A03030 [Torulaspora globosa]|uniref:Ribophorin II C-terminal domain-containing protein n=1 Tax=Torulaspora globosa TaxID=48254 RepID=A0A7G3ZAF0_9SACH|nr:uncharacterized protein HG536_0A03030 [Torulaspora globosa]QLL30486.1 hypothetical protein HG536_0A03030 [Torulaspora globosa]